jgi:methylated-DNA-protein-cysteine methyltransferase-like protein
VAKVPAGRLATYGQIALAIGAPGAARQVGWALRRLPLPSPLPWHLIVNARGRITMTASREGSDWLQRQRLIEEGIPVALDGRLPLERYLWMRSAPLRP